MAENELPLHCSYTLIYILMYCCETVTDYIHFPILPTT